MKNFVTLLSIISFHLSCLASDAPSSPLEHCLRKVNHDVSGSEIQNIDFIYLINLDKRPDRLKRSLEQLAPYRIHPQRFPAILGAQLSANELNAIGLKFGPGMKFHQWALSPSPRNNLEHDFPRTASYGKTFFSSYMNHGAIGCALSHLSVLQDAYDFGYETIWVMEDDISVKTDPHKLTALIHQLNILTNGSGWDVLYTDSDEYKEKTDIQDDFWWMQRPDFTSVDKSSFCKRSKTSDDFIKIASRTRTHSMVIRRSGMKKILDHIKQHGLFLPYDHEIPFAEEIQLYMLRYPIVSWIENTSDSDIGH